MKYYFYFFLFGLISTASQAQQWMSQTPWDFGKGFGGQAGISVCFGTHQSRVGLLARFFYAHEHFQINLQAGGWYYGETLGSEKATWEGSLKLGVVGSWGKKDSLRQPFMNEVSNQTQRRFAAGYSYNWYFNQIGTSQLSGTFGMQFTDFKFVFENDFLAFTSQDKYRSGAMGIYYRYQNLQFGLYHAAWTGDPYKGSIWHKKSEERPFPSRYGYIDMSTAPYGDRSAGIIAAQVAYILPMSGGQVIDLHVGIDAEQIRNTFQNKLIHDSPILPLNWGKNGNPHIPMVASDGQPYLYLPGQKIRKPRFLMQCGWNGTGWW